MSRVRPALRLLPLALPLLGLWLLRASPGLDARWEHHPAHFWIVVTGAAVSVVLGVWVSEAAGHRRDARLLLVSMAFLSSAGFLLLHALATPAVLLPGKNTGFVVATPVGLFLGACCAAASSANLGRGSAERVLGRRAWLLGGLALVLVGWAAASLLELPPFDTPLREDAAAGLVQALAVGGVALYSVAALRYGLLLRSRAPRVALGVVAAFTLLAEAMVAIALARSWHVSWWEWHALMAVAFGFVAWSAQAERQREGAAGGVFDAIALEQTLRRVHEQYDGAVRALVAEIRAAPDPADRPVGELAGRVADRYRLTEGQAGVLAHAAAEIADLLDEQAAEIQRRERIEGELRVARLIQQRFLPTALPSLPGWTVDTWYHPAREVGGDFYDFIPLPDGLLGIVVGDVSDKGVPAALVMASTHSILRAEATRLVAPAEVLQRANELLVADTPATMFATCLYAVLDPASGRLRFANAGHNLPYLRTEAGVTELRATGMPLGLLPGMGYEERTAELPPGANLLFHSDGLVEAHGPGREMFGMPRLAGLAGRAQGSALLDLLQAELRRFTGAGWEQEDDITLVTLERAGAGAAPAPATDRRPGAVTVPSR